MQSELLRFFLFSLLQHVPNRTPPLRLMLMPTTMALAASMVELVTLVDTIVDTLEPLTGVAREEMQML